MKTIKPSIAVLASLVSILCGSGVAFAGTILGDNVEIVEYFPTFGVVYGPATAPNIISSGGYDFGSIGFSQFDIKVTPSQIILTPENAGGLGGFGGTFNGFDIQDLTSSDAITSVSLATSGGLLTAGLTFDSHDVIVNLSGSDITGPIVVDFATGGVTGGVPEASTWAMMLLGFAGIGLAGYRRQKAAKLA